MGRYEKKKASKKRHRSEEKLRKRSKKRRREKDRGREGGKRKKNSGARDDAVTSDSGSSLCASPPKLPSAVGIQPSQSSDPPTQASCDVPSPIGPQFPPPSTPADENPDANPPTPKRAARGPQRPPQSILDAAQVLLDEPMVGPLPPDIQEEVGFVSDDVRSKEADRVLRVAVVAEENGVGFVDAFKVLGVEEGAGDAEVKKKYWMLSLMVHPDKCPHPRAQQAFQAVNAAFNKIGSAAGRASVRSEKEDAQLRQQAQEEAEQVLRQQQWDVVRSGGALADMKTTGPPTRQSWMTELPPERQKPKYASQVNVTSFSQRGIQGRGDTSAWTNTPMCGQPSMKPAIAGSAGAMSIEGGAGRMASGGGAGVRGTTVRKSLVEQHLEKLKKEKKLKKKQKKEEEKNGQGRKGGFKGWKPFDRERDLQAPRDNAKSLEQVMQDAQSLSRRFG